MFGPIGGPNHNRQKPNIRKETVMVPVGTARIAGGFAPSQSTPVRKITAASTAATSPLSTAARSGTAAGIKRNAISDLEQETPAARLKLQNGQAGRDSPQDSAQRSRPASAPKTGTPAGNKRKATVDPDEDAPVKRGKLMDVSKIFELPSPPPPSSRTGTSAANKRKAGGDLEDGAPVKRGKLMNDGQRRKLSGSDELASAPSMSSRTGAESGQGEGSALAGTKQTTAPDQSAVAPTCPEMASSGIRDPSSSQTTAGLFKAATLDSGAVEGEAAASPSSQRESGELSKAAAPKNGASIDDTTAPEAPVKASSDHSEATIPNNGATVNEQAAVPSPPKEKKEKGQAGSGEIGSGQTDVNAKGVAKPAGKKRSRSGEDEGDAEAPEGKRVKQLSSATGSGRSSGSSSFPKRWWLRSYDLNGLTNHMNSCFSGVVIQLLDAALDAYNIDVLLGEPEEVDSFGMTYGDLQKLDKTDHHGVLDPKLIKKQKSLRAAIKAAARAGETDRVSPAKYLRSLLRDLQTEYQGTLSQHVSPYLFQSVMAFGAARNADQQDDNVPNYEEMSGDRQEDCFGYYQTLINELVNDKHVGNSEMLKKLFEIESATTDICGGCGYKSSPRIAINNYHSVPVPELENGESAELGELYKESKRSAREDPCPECGKDQLTAKTVFTKIPENIVLKMDRTRYDNKPTKVDTLVELDRKKFDFNGVIYEVTAVIRHASPSPMFGHYTIFRKFDHAWHLLDDKSCSRMSANEVKDDKRKGQCAMLLLKKIAGRS